MYDETQEVPVFPDQNLAFAAKQANLERRRQLARSLIEQGLKGNTGAGYQGGRVYIVGNPLGNIASSIAGNILDSRAGKEAEQLQQQQEQFNAQQLAAIPSAGPERQQAQLKALQNPSLRQTIAAQMGLDKDEQNRIERGEQLAADREARAAEREATRQWQQEQNALYKRTLADAIALKQAPSVVVHAGGGKTAMPKPPSGYRWNEDQTELEPIPGGPKDASNAPAKPLTSAQEKAALELGGTRETLGMLGRTFKDEYAGDLRSTLQRKFGEVAGGAAPASTQAMTRWWADQAMFDELPQRHELFGATLTAGEKSAWNAAAISPSMAPSAIRERIATRQKILDNAEARMRGSVEASGKNTKQFDAAVGKPAATVRERTLSDEDLIKKWSK